MKTLNSIHVRKGKSKNGIDQGILKMGGKSLISERLIVKLGV